MSPVSYISLTVDVSVDGRNWEDCCGDEDKTHFYLDDKKDEIDKIQINKFQDLVAARFIRIKVSTGMTHTKILKNASNFIFSNISLLKL